MQELKQYTFMNLFLILTGHWFKMHHTGGKSIEYRTITEYWRKRLYTADGCRNNQYFRIHCGDIIQQKNLQPCCTQ